MAIDSHQNPFSRLLQQAGRSIWVILSRLDSNPVRSQTLGTTQGIANSVLVNNILILCFISQGNLKQMGSSLSLFILKRMLAVYIYSKAGPQGAP